MLAFHGPYAEVVSLIIELAVGHDEPYAALVSLSIEIAVGPDQLLVDSGNLCYLPLPYTSLIASIMLLISQ